MLTIIESPYAGDIVRNKLYLRRCVLKCIANGEVPFASHGFYTQFLDDEDMSIEREIGIRLGYTFWECAKLIAFYTDYGMTTGMLRAHQRCTDLHKPYELRTIGKNDAQNSDGPAQC
jgi:hypothetical protein